MKIICLFIGVFIISISMYAQSTSQVSGVISSNTTWQTDTVLMTGDVTIIDGVTLTIKAGTKIVPLGYYKLDVKGRLLAIGQPNNFIQFYVRDTVGLRDTSTVKGAWNGIHFESIKEQNDSSILRYCRISNGKAIGQTRKEQLGGAILIDSCSKLLIENCQITDNIAWFSGGGIQIRYNSSPKIIKNLIANNYTYYLGGGISVFDNSAPIIEQNIIIKNTSFHSDRIQNYIFYGGSGGGLYISSQTVAPRVAMNIISNNTAYESAVYESTIHAVIVSNIIVNNHSGGISNGTQRSSAIYANNTICNNYGFGLFSASTGLLVTNNIIRGNIPRDNAEDNLYFILGGYPIFRNNNIEMPSVSGQNNINTPSVFVRPTTRAGSIEMGYEADWQLKVESPEKDAGTLASIADIIGDKDVYGNKRIQGNSIDMGAAEYTAPNSTQTLMESKDIKIFPNPFSEQVWIEISDYYKDLHYQIISVSGQIMTKGTFKEKTNLLETHQLINGHYVLTIVTKDNKVIYSAKITKSR